MKKYAVLLIVYKRYHNLEHLITILTKSNIRIYAYVDIDDNSSKENLNAISIVKKYTDLGQIASHINKRNLGAGSAIPKAIDWVFNHEDYVLVIEDDCELGDHALEYFENSINYLSAQVKIISGRSAYAETDKFRPINKLTLTNYSLTNGWLTSRKSWQNISRGIESGVKFRLYLLAVLRKPLKTLPVILTSAASISLEYGTTISKVVVPPGLKKIVLPFPVTFSPCTIQVPIEVVPILGEISALTFF
jgi:hypothetical protein